MGPKEYKEYIDILLGVFNVEFIDAPNASLADGWYIWRNNPDWPVLDYRMVEVIRGEMCDETPIDSLGTGSIIKLVTPYGQLAGPIMLR